MKIRRKSQVWLYFTLDRDGKIGECNQCGSKLKYHKSTSTFKRHLELHNITINTEDNFDNDQQGQVNQMTLDSIISNINESREGGKISAEFVNNLVSMIVTCGLPFSLVEQPGFKLFTKKCLPRLKLPSRNTIKNLVETKFTAVKTQLMIQMKEIDFYSLTFDSWTEPFNNRSYLGVTIHYIVESGLESRIIAVKEHKESHTAANICLMLENVLVDWDLDKNKLICCVTDNGANMKSAVESFSGRTNHIACYAHTLNLTVKDIIESDSDFKGVVKKVKDIVNYFKSSSIASQLLRQSQLSDSSEKPLKLKQSCPTRWNSLYTMLERFINLHIHVYSVVSELKSTVEMPNQSEIALIMESLKLLRPFLQATEELSGEKMTTLSKAIPITNLIKKSFNLYQPIHPVALKLKELAIKIFDRRFTSIETSSFHVKATLLDPRFKRNDFSNIIFSTQAMSKVNQELNQIQPIKTLIEQVSEDDSSLWSLRSVQQDTGGITIDESLKMYLNSPLADIKACPLAIWKSMKQFNPNIAKLALKYLCIPATSVPSERIFSKAGRIVSKLRSNLDPKKVEELVILMNQNVDFVFNSNC